MKTKITLQVSEDLKERIEEMAERNGISQADAIRMVLNNYIVENVGKELIDNA